MLITIAIGSMGGGAFFVFNMPLPWMLGAIFANPVRYDPSQLYLSITVSSWLAYDKFVMCGLSLCCRYCMEHSTEWAADSSIAGYVAHRIVHPVRYCY